MARLVLPYKSSAFVRTSLLGLISPAPVITLTQVLSLITCLGALCLDLWKVISCVTDVCVRCCIDCQIRLKHILEIKNQESVASLLLFLFLESYLFSYVEVNKCDYYSLWVWEVPTYKQCHCCVWDSHLNTQIRSICQYSKLKVC